MQEIIMNEKKQPKDWGQIADKFDEISNYVVGPEINKEICEKLNKEKNLGKVIEFGCGTGYFTKEITDNAEHIIATDVSEEMLAAAKNKLINFKNITFQKVDCRKTAFPSEEFNTVLMINVLHVIKDPAYAVKESYRILKPGGLLITIDLTGYGMKKLEMLKLLFRYLRKMGKPPTKADKGNLSPNDLDSFAENSGFNIKENILIGDKIKALYFKGIKK